MRTRWIAIGTKLIVLGAVLNISQSALSWSRNDTNRSYVDQVTESTLVEMQRRLDRAEFLRQSESVEREAAATKAMEEARQEAGDLARKTAEQAEEAATEIRNEVIRSAVRTKNNIYLGGLLMMMGGFTTFLIVRARKEVSFPRNFVFQEMGYNAPVNWKEKRS